MQRLVPLLTILALAAAPLAAQMTMGQTAQQRPAMQMGGGDASMGVLSARFGKFAPKAVLEMRAHLALTDDQVAKLNTLIEEEQAAVQLAHAPAHAAHMELRKLEVAAEPDADAMRPFFMAHHTAEGNMQWVRATYALKARALLTAGQRSHIEQMGGAGHH